MVSGSSRVQTKDAGTGKGGSQRPQLISLPPMLHLTSEVNSVLQVCQPYAKPLMNTKLLKIWAKPDREFALLLGLISVLQLSLLPRAGAIPCVAFWWVPTGFHCDDWHERPPCPSGDGDCPECFPSPPPPNQPPPSSPPPS